MPRYEFVCECGQGIVESFAMQEVPAVVGCAGCGGKAKRIFAVPQVKTAMLCSEANKRGLAEMDATRRTDERAYTRNWDRRLPGL